eukprot:5041691-Prymnesium_polylepis.2
MRSPTFCPAVRPSTSLGTMPREHTGSSVWVRCFVSVAIRSHSPPDPTRHPATRAHVSRAHLSPRQRAVLRHRHERARGCALARSRRMVDSVGLAPALQVQHTTEISETCAQVPDYGYQHKPPLLYTVNMVTSTNHLYYILCRIEAV